MKRFIILILFFIAAHNVIIAQIDSVTMARKDSVTLDSIIAAIMSMPSYKIDNPIAVPVFLPVKYFQRGDTIFEYYLYQTENQLDSVECSDTITIRLSHNKWAYAHMYDSNFAFILKKTKTIYIVKFRKIKKTKWFLKYNDKYFKAENECKRVYEKAYNSDGSRFIRWIFLGRNHVWNIPSKKIKNGRALLYKIPASKWRD